ncbi:MAG: hypothetical protein ACE5D3_01530, partial [Candidatus Binatia bacterium]
MEPPPCAIGARDSSRDRIISEPFADRVPPCTENGRRKSLRKQIIVNVSMNEVRVALLENGILAEIHI